MTEIKICGVTNELDTVILNRTQPEYAGFVMFYPKSRRNQTLAQAKDMAARLHRDIKKVAVLVSPTVKQIESICNLKENGKKLFHILQIHGELSEESYLAASLPIWKAFNGTDVMEYETYRTKDKVTGFVFDAATYGSGETFDWQVLKGLQRDSRKWILAGGLTTDNVREAIKAVAPDGVDVSSYVENKEKNGKDLLKVESFIRMVRYGKYDK